jgi:homeobox protein YOX1/YHP1
LPSSPVLRANRWQPSYLPQSNGFSSANFIRSPTALDLTAAAGLANPVANQACSSLYDIRQPLYHSAPMNSQNHGSHSTFDDSSRLEPRSSSSYGLSSWPSHLPPPKNYSPPSSPPVSPTPHEEPTIKRKRIHPDAAQLKVLNETYTRTAFPSTEELAALAKMLDMSPRGVQLW